MRSEIECVSCTYRIYTNFCKTIMQLDDTAVQEKAKWFLKEVAGRDFADPPPEFGRFLWDDVLRTTGRADPLRAEKDADNNMLLAQETYLNELLRTQPDPFRAAVLLAIGGNVLDSAVDIKSESDAVIKQALSTPLAIDDTSALRDAIRSSENILYLLDNAGEIVMDKLFLRYMFESGITRPERITLGVRGGASLNDAIRQDVESVGLADMVRVIDNGDYSWGTLLSACSPEFLAAYTAADLIIAKGMGNYETLDDCGRPIAFMLMTKCNPLSKAFGVPINSYVCALKNMRSA